eukprot:1288032-Rhodomonas_salina.4
MARDLTWPHVTSGVPLPTELVPGEGQVRQRASRYPPTRFLCHVRLSGYAHPVFGTDVAHSAIPLRASYAMSGFASRLLVVQACGAMPASRTDTRFKLLPCDIRHRHSARYPPNSFQTFALTSRVPYRGVLGLYAAFASPDTPYRMVHVPNAGPTAPLCGCEYPHISQCGMLTNMGAPLTRAQKRRGYAPDYPGTACRCIRLRARYAMSGTDMLYGAPGVLLRGTAAGKLSLSAYALCTTTAF